MAQNAGAHALKVWLFEHEKTQAELAAVIGVAQQTVSSWLLGRDIKLAHAFALERATGIPVSSWDPIPDESANTLPDVNEVPAKTG